MDEITDTTERRRPHTRWMRSRIQQRDEDHTRDG
ncbi:hypothetical protein NP493_483g02058 [Ridgeia piscesae]|uniref:Uncharacterized protein n=1 Tax=Ridgeia piscesae TaxID=27915 RepID=A0AAD9KXM9_RIDPI|nr:hypothetical protein NP493_483g02043 [Ridgeia piscesae]KAK2179567.1 hypothetical protein NP493_483g02050 [Ridgeia piscesae]KAK2179568.1 hypothetical protein NP493_483g02059 [Ridgeia piscesae]KAK2179569.1 hypothetical protein NP493_483g02052 [Ridgeia piscesae]KAK2179570.1 hypothetical protein NP493_483g02055 [Ridgeia piscesae]